MFTPVALAALFVVFIAFTWVLALADSALTYISRREAEEVLREHPGSRILEVTAERDAHLGALRVWRFITEALGAVCLTAAAVWVLEGVWAAVGVAALVLVATAALLGVWSPRPIGSRNETAVARRTAGLVWGLRRALGPIGTRLGQDRRRGDDEVNEEDDFEERHLREVVARAHDADVLADSEAELIQSVFSMNDTIVRSVMVPRTDVVTIDDDHTLAQSMDLFLRSGCSRVPVIGEDADDVRGMLYLKDVTRALHHEGAASGDPVTRWMRDVRFVPDSKSVAGLLQELQRESTHVAIVVDEYGGTAGLVTLEDLIEEIVGEIYDEDDLPDRPEVEVIEPGVYSVDARMGIGDFREEFDLPEPEDHEDDDVDTVGGLLAKELGRVPIRGSQVTVQGLVIVAAALEPRRNRVDRLRVIETEDRPPRVRRRDEEPHGSTAVDPTAH
ncbi:MULTISPECIES: hemolysin family protein [Micrococcus]|uniref:hemolysin family protein n=1 Tax=Micrococcus antarcticus TaxID=86171 RepID=UPI00384DBC0E